MGTRPPISHDVPTMVNPADRSAVGAEEPLLYVEHGLSGRAALEQCPLNDMSERELRALARRAHRLRRRDMERFQDLAAEQDISVRQLRLLADAWVEGGGAGVRALGPGVPTQDAAMARAEAVIETWRRRHFPLDALQVDVWRNRLTVWWLLPAEDRTAALERRPLMELRRTPDGRWHLYRRAVQGEWWPVLVRGRRRHQSLSACLDMVRVDPLHQFWGSANPAAGPDLQG